MALPDTALAFALTLAALASVVMAAAAGYRPRGRPARNRFGVVFRRAAAFALTCLLHAVSAAAEVSAPETAVTFYTENDDWPPDTGTDKNYTNGFRLTIDCNSDVLRLHERRLFRWVPSHPSCSEANLGKMCISTAFHFGQQFYTPDDITVPQLQPHDRPYAGWLYAGGSWTAASNDKAMITDVYLGATGPVSLAEPVQTLWHELVGAAEPKGWDHQIGGRFGVVVGHSRHWGYDIVTNGHRWLELSPFLGGNLGNVMTDAYAGARIKVGYNITPDWTQGAISPVNVRNVARPGLFEVFVSLEGRGRIVGYNVFLDAADQHQLNRQPGVADGGIGVGIRIGGSFMVTYRVARITREYDEAATPHEYKAVRITIVFR